MRAAEVCSCSEIRYCLIRTCVLYWFYLDQIERLPR